MPYFALDWLRRAPRLDAIHMLDLIDDLDLVDLAVGYHLVLEGPTCATGEFGYNDVAVPEEVYIEVDVVNRLFFVSAGRASIKNQPTSLDM
jgi:hypothetical protein